MDVRFVPCPLCGESIHPVAGRCKYCRCDVVAARRASAAVEPPPALPSAPASRWARRAIAVAAVAGAAAVGALTATPRKPHAATVVAVTPPRAAVEAPAQKPGMYATIAGTWRGVGQQYDIHTSWELVMKLDAKDVGYNERIGTIEYPSLGCKGELLRENEEGNTFVVIEEISTNPGNACVPRGRIKLERRGDNLDWRYYYLMDPREAASAQLTR